MTDEQSSRVRLTRRKLLAGLGTIGAAGAASGAGTFALFSDSEASTGNEIDMGTMDLTIKKNNQTSFSNGVSGTFSLAKGKPTDTFGGRVTLRNEGSLDADHTEIGFSVDGPSGMAEQFEVVKFEYPREDSTYEDVEPSDLNGNNDGLLTLRELVDNNDGTLGDLRPAPHPQDSVDLKLGFKWLDDANHDLSHPNNDFQGDTLDVTIHFALAQEPGQDVL